MAYRRQDMTRLGSDGSFPNQKLQNASSPTSNDGTLFDEACMGDWFQFFQKCFEESGIVPNGSPDNGNTLNQLYEAVHGGERVPISSFNSGIAAGTIGNPISVRKTRGGKAVLLEGWVQISGATQNFEIFTIPAGFRPQQELRSIVIGFGGNQTRELLLIDETGLVQVGGLWGEIGSEAHINVEYFLD